MTVGVWRLQEAAAALLFLGLIGTAIWMLGPAGCVWAAAGILVGTASALLGAHIVERKGRSGRRVGAKNAAASALAHDLRAPSAAIEGAARLALAAERDGKKTEEYLRQILAANRMLAFVAREAAAGNAQSSVEVFAARELEELLRLVVGPRCEEKGQSLTIDMEEIGENRYRGDCAALSRVLINLLLNAVKYTPEGGRISLTATQSADGTGLDFSVADTGMGMTQAFLARMYQPYARAKEAEGIQGTGLGLAIVKRLVERAGGRIEARSEKGKGTKFFVRFPLERMREEQSVEGMRVLLVEDDALGARIGSALLRQAGAQVVCVRGGEEAAARFSVSRPGRFDAVLTDMRMPGMDGCATARAIRESGHADARRVPILALTAGADEEDMRRAKEAGMNGYLLKPVSAASLARGIAEAKRAMERAEEERPAVMGR